MEEELGTPWLLAVRTKGSNDVDIVRSSLEELGMSADLEEHTGPASIGSPSYALTFASPDNALRLGFVLSEKLSQAPIAIRLAEEPSPTLERPGLGISDAAFTAALETCDAYQKEEKLDELFALAEALTQLPSTSDIQRAQAFDWLGGALWMRGELEEAAAQLSKALAIATREDDQELISKCLSHLGDVALEQGQDEQAIQHFRDAQIALDEKERPGAVSVLEEKIGEAHRTKGDYKAAQEYLNRACQLAESAQQPQRVSSLRNKIAAVTCDMGKVQEGMALFQQALSDDRARGDKTSIARSLTNISKVYGILQEWDNAKVYQEEALQLLKEIGHRLGEATVLSHMARLDISEQNPLAAVEKYKQALAIARELGHWQHEVSYLLGLGCSYQQANDLHNAQKLLNECEEGVRDLGIEESVNGCMLFSVAAQCEHKLGNAEDAKAYYEEAAHAAKSLDLMNFPETDATRIEFLKAKEMLEPDNG